VTVESVLVWFSLIPGIVLLAELAISLIKKTDPPANVISQVTKYECRLAIIMPAHNEEAVVEKSVQSVHSQLSIGDLLVVVADNCTDNTAKAVRSLNLEGVIILERFDSIHRGKGFALSYGYNYLIQKEEAYDLLGIIDADCQFSEQGSIDLIKQECKYEDLFQVRYLMKSNENNSLMSAFAWYLKTSARSVGMSRLFGACHIQGSGFFFSSRVMNLVNFASGSIVEDLELGLNMAEEKVFCKYVSNVTLLSEMPSDFETLQTQKSRWEVGHLNILLNESFPRALRAIKQLNPRYFFLICDLSIPPLVTYLIFLTIFMVILLIIGSVTSTIYFVYFLTILSLIYFHWRRFCKSFNVNFEFIQLVTYSKIKLKVVINYFNKKARVWNKTKR